MQQAKGVTNFNFMGIRRWAYTVSGLLILASLTGLGVRGINFGIDFTGGILVEVGYSGPAQLDQIRAVLQQSRFQEAQVQTFGAANDVLVRLPPLPGGEAEQDVRDEVLMLLRMQDPSVELRRVDFVGPQVGQDLTEQGGLAMLFALLMILAYVAFRFQWKFAVGAVAALIHDVTITLGFFAWTGISFDLTVLAALLAVIGYSLNDTIVVFDRIRENLLRIRRETPEAVMTYSINQVLSRTIITALTTLLVLFALFFLGGEAVSGFSIALIVGIVVGTYSSTYVASALALAFNVTPKDLMPPQRTDESVDNLP
jgi:preprotein translocase subunit SecF